jgi:sarcosine oxidase subunit beta
MAGHLRSGGSWVAFVDSLPASADVVIIGGGIIGCATAYFARQAGLRTLVIEKRAALATLTTPVATGGFRLQFDNQEEIELVRESVTFFDQLAERHDIGLTHQGYLFVSRTAEGARQLTDMGRRMIGWGVAVELMTGDDARRRFPYLAGDVNAARWGPHDGWLDSRRLALALAEGSGADFALEVTATGFLRQGDRVTGVRTSQGEVSAAWTVVATGPLSGPLLAAVGLDFGLTTVRRQKLIVPDLPLVPGDAPMTIEVETGAHWRPGMRGAHGLWTAPAPAEPPAEDVPPSADFAFGLLNPDSDHALARATPFWREAWASPRLQWWVQAGQYTYTPDRRPLLGPSPMAGLAINTGYSGHGIMGSLGGSRRAVDAVLGKLRPDQNPFRPDRPMVPRAFDIL